jgi:4-hydroxy-3-methylbut-2-enyl diphosphate reductase IspH
MADSYNKEQCAIENSAELKLKSAKSVTAVGVLAGNSGLEATTSIP